MSILITPVVKTKGGEGGREGRMCALISGLREFEMRRDVSYKYRQAVIRGAVRTLPAPELYTPETLWK